MITDAVMDTDCRALRGIRQLACEKRKDFLTGTDYLQWLILPWIRNSLLIAVNFIHNKEQTIHQQRQNMDQIGPNYRPLDLFVVLHLT